MNILAECRVRIKASAAREPLLIIPMNHLNDFLELAYGDTPIGDPNKKVVYGVPWRCMPTVTGSPFVIDLK